MKIIDKNTLGCGIDKVESGTLIEYGDTELNSYGYGIVISDMDKTNTVIFDIEDNVYYADISNYRVLKIFKNPSIVIE